MALESSFQVNLIDSGPSIFLVLAELVRGGRLIPCDRGRGACTRPQCQICGRLGHLAQRCYY